MEESKKTLKHFTNVSALKKILKTGLKFSDGKNWLDKDDRFAFEFYYKKTKKHVQAICFCDSDDTAHHWKLPLNINVDQVQENDEDIMCYIGFSSDFKECLKLYFQLSGLVEYKKYAELNSYIQNKKLECILKLKKYHYSVENEFRVLYISDKEEEKFIPLDILRKYITKIIIARNVSKEKYEEIKSFLEKENLECKINKSSLRQSQRWQKGIEKYFECNNNKNIYND